MRQVWPLALMLCADRVPNKKAYLGIGALTQAGSPDPGTTVSALRRHALANWCCQSSFWPVSCRQRQLRLLVFLAPDHDGPGHRRNLVGERDGRHLGWSTFHQPAKPGTLLRSVFARVKAADTNRCFGSRYNAAMGAWLKEHGLDGVNNQERYRALLILENLAEIETWRAGPLTSPARKE
jgi:hypothetical protein